MAADGNDPQAEWYATEQESSTQIMDMYPRVRVFTDETIDGLPLEAIGHVAHSGGAEVTLNEILIHKIADRQRHAGHADIVREQIDGAAGLLPAAGNLPDGMDWSSYVAKLVTIADGV